MIEPAFAELEAAVASAKGFGEAEAAHVRFLSGIASESFLDTPAVADRVTAILQLAARACALIETGFGGAEVRPPPDAEVAALERSLDEAQTRLFVILGVRIRCGGGLTFGPSGLILARPGFAGREDPGTGSVPSAAAAEVQLQRCGHGQGHCTGHSESRVNCYSFLF